MWASGPYGVHLDRVQLREPLQERPPQGLATVVEEHVEVLVVRTARQSAERRREQRVVDRLQTLQPILGRVNPRHRRQGVSVLAQSDDRLDEVCEPRRPCGRGRPDEQGTQLLVEREYVGTREVRAVTAQETDEVLEDGLHHPRHGGAIDRRVGQTLNEEAVDARRQLEGVPLRLFGVRQFQSLSERFGSGHILKHGVGQDVCVDATKRQRQTRQAQQDPELGRQRLTVEPTVVREPFDGREPFERFGVLGGRVGRDRRDRSEHRRNAMWGRLCGCGRRRGRRRGGGSGDS